MTVPVGTAELCINRPARNPIRIRWWIFAYMFGFAMVVNARKRECDAADSQINLIGLENIIFFFLRVQRLLMTNQCPHDHPSNGPRHPGSAGIRHPS
jgi:hypothetical protein